MFLRQAERRATALSLKYHASKVKDYVATSCVPVCTQCLLLGTSEKCSEKLRSWDPKKELIEEPKKFAFAYMYYTCITNLLCGGADSVETAATQSPCAAESSNLTSLGACSQKRGMRSGATIRYPKSCGEDRVYIVNVMKPWLAVQRAKQFDWNFI